MKHPPLKRHVSLQPLSRDHYGGLVVAQKLIRSAGSDAEARARAVAALLKAWDDEIDAHFQDEERLLIPLMTEVQSERLRREHALLRQRVADARSTAGQAPPGADWVAQTGRMLDDHIRWEERELFPAIEQAASADILAQIGEATAAAESTRPRRRQRREGPGEGR